VAVFFRLLGRLLEITAESGYAADALRIPWVHLAIDRLTTAE